MSTRTLSIWCPDWCTVSEQRHLDDLHLIEGDVIHTGAEFGHIADEQYALTMVATPDGTPTPDAGQADVMCIAGDGHVYDPEAMERHAYALLAMVAQARTQQKERQQ